MRIGSAVIFIICFVAVAGIGWGYLVPVYFEQRERIVELENQVTVLNRILSDERAAKNEGLAKLEHIEAEFGSLENTNTLLNETLNAKSAENESLRDQVRSVTEEYCRSQRLLLLAYRVNTSTAEESGWSETAQVMRGGGPDEFFIPENSVTFNCQSFEVPEVNPPGASVEPLYKNPLLLAVLGMLSIASFLLGVLLTLIWAPFSQKRRAEIQ